VAKSKAQLGPDHSDTVTSIAELALTYERAGRRREADAVLGQALEKPNARLEHVALAILRERSQLFAAGPVAPERAVNSLPQCVTTAKPSPPSRNLQMISTRSNAITLPAAAAFGRLRPGQGTLPRWRMESVRPFVGKHSLGCGPDLAARRSLVG